MKGFYFINTDLRTTRAHTSQVLHTIAALQDFLPLSLVAPQFPELDLKMITQRHDLPRVPDAALLWNFNIRRPGILAFILFNIPATLFLLIKKIKGEAGFIYVRATYFLPLILIAFVFRVPCFYETHRRPVSLPERLRDDLIARMTAGHVIISERVREYYTRYKKPTLVVHDAVALKRFAVRIGKAQAREQLGFAQDTRICVYTGTVSSLKGIDYLVGAARLLPDVSFILAGRIATEFKGVTIPLNITLMGEREQGELPAILQAADTLLLPHPDNDYSQSPMKLFEYMASGVPIVASRLPSISEILNDDNSVLVEAGRAETLAEGITTVFGDKERAVRLAAQAQRDVADYTWEPRGQKIAAFIRETLNHDS